MLKNKTAYDVKCGLEGSQMCIGDGHHTGSTTSKPNLYSAGPQSQRSPGLSIYEGTVLSIYEGIVSAVASESYPRYDISTYLSVRGARAFRVISLIHI